MSSQYSPPYRPRNFSVEVEEYCENCNKFEPEVMNEGYYADDGLIVVCHHISCVNASNCQFFYKMIKRKIEEDKNE